MRTLLFLAAVPIGPLLLACSTDSETSAPPDSGSPGCANLPAERIDTIEFNPATDCGDGGSDDAGDAGEDAGTRCNCEALCRQRIGSEVVSCKFLTRNRADCAVKQNCPGR